MLLIALHFASCLSSLTLLRGESWRVRYALIRCIAILQRPASDGRIRKTPVQPARLFLARWSGIISSHPQEADVRGEQASPGESGRCLAGLTPPSHPFSPPSPDRFPRPRLSCNPPLDTSAGIWSAQHTNMSYRYSHKLYNNYLFLHDSTTLH